MAYFYVVSQFHQGCQSAPNYDDSSMTYDGAVKIIYEYLHKFIKNQIILNKPELSDFLLGITKSDNCNLIKFCSISIEYMIRSVYQNMLSERKIMFMQQTENDEESWNEELLAFLLHMIDTVNIDSLINEYIKLIPLQTNVEMQDIGMHKKSNIIGYINPHSTPFVNSGTSPFCWLIKKIPIYNVISFEV